MSPRPLEDRVALVTGANQGIGAAIAAELGRLGASVLVTYFRLPSAAAPAGLPPLYGTARQQDGASVLEALHDHGVPHRSVEADLTDASSAGALFESCEEHLGPVAILINNASGWCQDTFTRQSNDDFGRTLERVSDRSVDHNFLIDARGGALLMAEMARRHQERGATWGRIVSLSSGGPGGFPSEVSYGAAKAALENYTMSAATELARFGITANVVHPPITDTGWITDDVHTFAEAHGGHVATPGEIAEVVGWLCTDSARLVTGNRIRLR